MEKADLAQQFAGRLRDAMIAAGHHSQRSTSGVCLHTLSEITSHSLQICRKYLRGEAIPEPVKLRELASKLKVSPGWLLFGDTQNYPTDAPELISINKRLLYYLFVKAACLYNRTLSEQEVAGFLLELINDVSLINATEAQSQKIIDLALVSVTHFNRKNPVES